MMWNIYFGVIALAAGLLLRQCAWPMARKSASNPLIQQARRVVHPCSSAATPLFIQFFFAYEMLVLLPEA